MDGPYPTAFLHQEGRVWRVVNAGQIEKVNNRVKGIEHTESGSLRLEFRGGSFTVETESVTDI